MANQYNSSSSASASYSASSFTSSSYSTFSSSSASTNSRGQTESYSQRYTELMNSNDRDGTHIRRVSEESGKPTITEQRHIPAGGRISNDDRARDSTRIEDVSDDLESEHKGRDDGEGDERYEERIEDEYAKREGGA